MSRRYSIHSGESLVVQFEQVLNLWVITLLGPQIDDRLTNVVLCYFFDLIKVFHPLIGTTISVTREECKNTYEIATTVSFKGSLRVYLINLYINLLVECHCIFKEVINRDIALIIESVSISFLSILENLDCWKFMNTKAFC